MDRHDVVVVGGGIAGASLATVLARAGLDVLVLEREREFQDQARGEYLAPWGVREAADLGLLDLLLEAPYANVITQVVSKVGTDRWEDPQRDVVDLAAALPGIPGALGVGHPQASSTLLSGSTVAGAAVLRGAEQIEVHPGRQPVVSFRLHGRLHERGARLVVGADGRASTVRQQLGVTLESSRPDVYLAGLLVSGVAGWPEDTAVVGVRGATRFQVFPQREGRVRLYAAHEASAFGRFGGPEATSRFLASFRQPGLPVDGEGLASAAPAGPCLAIPANDSWTERPAGDGVVLIGDAAGWSDPGLGQGLAVALRDVAVLSDVLRSSDDWSPLSPSGGLRAYFEERAERMRRLRVVAALVSSWYGFGADGERRRRRIEAIGHRDARLAMTCAAPLVGPWHAPADGFDPSLIEALGVA